MFAFLCKILIKWDQLVCDFDEGEAFYNSYNGSFPKEDFIQINKNRSQLNYQKMT